MVYFILYVADQQKSRVFYETLLQQRPTLDVPGMTEFALAGGAKLGLMPEAGIHRILGDRAPHPAQGNGVPRCELYLMEKDPEAAYHRAVVAGATAVSPVQPRNWGHRAGYVSDPDGHIVAFATETGGKA